MRLTAYCGHVEEEESRTFREFLEFFAEFRRNAAIYIHVIPIFLGKFVLGYCWRRIGAGDGRKNAEKGSKER